jgi:hypothetical protein
VEARRQCRSTRYFSFETTSRLTDRAMRVGETVSIGEEPWLVQSETAPERADAAARYVCVPAESAG